MKTTAIIPPLLALSLAGCAATTPVSSTRITVTQSLEEQAREVAGYELFDSESARYRSLRAFRLSNGDIAVCGEQNGRNRFGGYVGFQTLYVRFTPGPRPIRRSVRHDFMADPACKRLDSGRPLPIVKK